MELHGFESSWWGYTEQTIYTFFGLDSNFYTEFISKLGDLRVFEVQERGVRKSREHNRVQEHKTDVQNIPQ